MTFGLIFKGNLQSFLSDSPEIYEMVLFKEGDICRTLPEVTKVFGKKATRILIGHFGASLISKERDRFEKAILKARGNKKLAAEDLGVSRATFYRRATELGLIQSREVESVKYS